MQKKGAATVQASNYVTYEGKLLATGLRFGIVCSRFNEFFTSKLLGGAVDCIVRHGGSVDHIEVAWVPGSFEIPPVVQRLAASRRFDALIGLGVVIQGATSHAEYINAQVSRGLSQIALEYGIPVIYGVVTTENIEQAIERAGSKAGNRGASAAESAIEMANLMKALPEAK